MIPSDSRLLRVYVDAHNRRQGRPVYEAIVAKARSSGLAGASVFPAEMGYGSHRWIHDAASEYGFIGLPVVIEIVDAPERIDALLAELGPMIAGVVATVQPVRVIRYARAEPGAMP
jgi:PII-like signaling protein